MVVRLAALASGNALNPRIEEVPPRADSSRRGSLTSTLEPIFKVAAGMAMGIIAVDAFQAGGIERVKAAVEIAALVKMIYLFENHRAQIEALERELAR